MAEQKNFFSLSAITACLLLSTGAFAQNNDPVYNHTEPDEGSAITTLYPILNCSDALAVRNIEGDCNNLITPLWGSIKTPLKRSVYNGYADQHSIPKTDSAPNPRTISNIVFSQNPTSIPNNKNASDLLWQFGQFLDHDLDLSDPAGPREDLSITIPAGDKEFDPDSTGTKKLRLSRSKYIIDDAGIRQQENELTSWIDGSQIYGSTEHRSSVLRMNDGSGRLKFQPTSNGDLLPFNNCAIIAHISRDEVRECLPNENADKDASNVFVAGDVRVNEQAGLIAMHTLFMREHNYQASLCSSNKSNTKEKDDEIFECARKIVIAELQKITFYDFLPILLGAALPEEYHGYNQHLDPSITNEFATASYRFGHSALSSHILRLDSNGNEISHKHLGLRDAFFCIDCITQQGGIDPILRGLSAQVHQAIDTLIVDDVRNFLFGMPGNGGEDLVARNIQRGRDHGLPSYTSARQQFGLTPVNRFEDIQTDAATREKLRQAYNDDVNAIDFWVGALAEKPVNNGLMGELNSHVIKAQFIALREGDRFWFENSGVLTETELHTVKNTSLSNIIRRNTGVGNELPDNVFIVDSGTADDEAFASSGSTFSVHPFPLFALPIAILQALR